MTRLRPNCGIMPQKAERAVLVLRSLIIQLDTVTRIKLSQFLAAGSMHDCPHQQAGHRYVPGGIARRRAIPSCHPGCFPADVTSEDMVVVSGDWRALKILSLDSLKRDIDHRSLGPGQPEELYRKHRLWTVSYASLSRIMPWPRR